MGSQGGFFESVSDQQHADERCWSRTAKSCGPDAPTLASSPRSCVGPTGLRQNLSADDGGKRARSPGRARHKLLKPLRAGMPGVPVYLLLLVCVLPIQSAHEAAGAAGTRHSPRPPWGREINAKLGRFASWGRERAFVIGSLKSESVAKYDCAIPQPSPPATGSAHRAARRQAPAGDPVFRSVSDGIEKPRRTGYSGGACHRARRRRDPVAEYDGLCEERSGEPIQTPSFRARCFSGMTIVSRRLLSQLLLMRFDELVHAAKLEVDVRKFSGMHGGAESLLRVPSIDPA